MDYDRDSTRAFHDAAGSIAVLRWACTVEECPQRADAVFYDRLRHVDLMAMVHPSTNIFLIFGF